MQPSETAQVAAVVSPNLYAPSPSLRADGPRLLVDGYQAFAVTSAAPKAPFTSPGPDELTPAAGTPPLPPCPVPLPHDTKLRLKHALLSAHFRPEVLRHRSVLDIGGNAGFFSLLARSCGAASAVSIDVDDAYTRLCRELAQRLGVTGFHAHTTNLAEWTTPADVVLAFAMVHWLYSATTGWSSLERVVEHLRTLTRSLLLVEWVAPGDPAIAFLGHLRINRSDAAGPYRLDTFLSALRSHFEVVEEVGRVSPTRQLWACWTSRVQQSLDLSWHLPVREEWGGVSRLLSSRRLATDPDGLGVWSRVYDAGDRILKQTTHDLARREAECLQRLGGNHAPRLLSFRQLDDGTSCVEMEKISGTPFHTAVAELRTKPSGELRLAIGLLRRLCDLARSGILHRDLRPDNILFQGEEPVVLDFGWSVLDGQETATPAPASLGEQFRPPDGSFSDTYSVGKLLLSVLTEACDPDLRLIAQQMAADRADERLDAVSAWRWLSVRFGRSWERERV